MRRRRLSANHQGTIYLTVLGVSVMVALIGLTGLTLTRLERRTGEATGRGVQADALVRSALELGLLAARGGSWRSDHTSGAWTAAASLGSGTVRYRFIDEADGSLTDNGSEPVLLQAEGTVGRAVRVLSARLDVDTDAAAGSGGDRPMKLRAGTVQRVMR